MSETHIANLLPAIPPAQSEDASADKWREQSDRIELGRQLRDLTLAAGKSYDLCRFGNYNAADAYRQQVLDAAKEWAATLPERLASRENLVLYGPVGTGKDHLAFAACRQAVIQHRKTVHWIYAQDWFGDVRDAMGDDDRTERSIIGKLTRADVLVISDPLPPFGPLSNHQATMLYRAVQARYADGGVSICTVNVKDDAEADLRMGAQSWDRLCDRAWKLHLSWESHRKPSREVKRPEAKRK